MGSGGLITQLKACLPTRKLFIWPPFYQYNRRLLRQKTVGAYLYMSRDAGYWLASFEVITPPQKLVLPRAKTENYAGGELLFCSKIWNFSGRNGIYFRRKFSFSRLLRTTNDPSRLIRPRPIGCDRVSEEPIKISYSFLFLPFLIILKMIRFFCSSISIAKKSFFIRYTSNHDPHLEGSP